MSLPPSRPTWDSRVRGEDTGPRAGQEERAGRLRAAESSVRLSFSPCRGSAEAGSSLTLRVRN